MVDVTILGAGAFGLSVAWACCQRGASVRVIDPAGVGAGASGGIVGALAPHTPERWEAKKIFQLESLLMAQTFWDEVTDAGGLSAGYGRVGRLQPIMNERGLKLAYVRVESAKELWRGRAEWNVLPVQDAGDWAPSSPTGFLVHDTLSARMHPRQACAALAAAIRAKGGEICSEGPKEGKIVWATGWQGLVEMSKQAGYLVGAGEKGQAALLDFDRKGLPQILAQFVHIVPHADGTVAIGSTSERYFDQPDVPDVLLDDVIARARVAMPCLANAPVIERWAGVRPRSASRRPILGEHPFRSGEFVVNGGFKIGFGIAPKVAQVMADLVLDGAHTIPADFCPAALI